LAVGVVHLVVLERQGDDYRKGRQFFKDKCAPQTNSWLRGTCGVHVTGCCCVV